jgi:Ca2+-transporting ATPase
MVTGDHPLTARAIAEQVGIWRPDDRVAVCSNDGEPPEITDDVRVVARARPHDKLKIVADLKTRGEVVAVTGDGVNDAPALRRADIGVAMGSGTEVAQQAAQLVLANDNLGTLEIAVAEGRRVYSNIRRFLRYALAGGAAELLTMLLGPLVGLAVPLLPAQILWINLLTHGLPGVAMGAEPASKGVMLRPPRSPEESVLGAGLGRAVLWTGGLIAICTLAIGASAAAVGWDWQPLVYLTLGLAQLGVAFAVRAHRRGGPGNPWLGIAVASSIVLLLGGVYVPPLSALLGTTSVPAFRLGLAVVVASIPGLVVAAVRRSADRHHVD